MTMFRTSRRTLLGGSAALAAITLPVAATPASNIPSGPDAELIRLLAEFDAASDAIAKITEDAYGRNMGDAALTALIEPHNDRQEVLLASILAAHATTPGAIVARARTLAGYAPDLAEDGKECWCERMLAALLRDALELKA